MRRNSCLLQALPNHKNPPSRYRKPAVAARGKITVVDIGLFSFQPLRIDRTLADLLPHDLTFADRSDLSFPQNG